MKTPTEMEFDAGANLAREGKELPDDASLAAKEGWQSVKNELASESDPKFYSTPPGTARAEEPPTEPPTPEPGPKILVLHKTPGLPENIVVATVPQPVPAPKDANDNVTITVVEQGKEYLVEGAGAKTTICFRDVTEEALIAILIDRLEGFKVASWSVYDENAVADLEKALTWLKARTRDRVARGVEGTSAI